MIWLRSNERFHDLAELDRLSGVFLVNNATSVGQKSDVHVDGTYALLNETFCALYRVGGSLFFRIGATEFELDDGTIVQVDGPATSRRIVVARNGQAIGYHDYVVREDDQFELDATPFSESEDFDFGLFVANVSQSPERKKVLLGQSGAHD